MVKLFHFFAVLRIFGKDVLVGRLTRRTMYKQRTALAMRAWHLAQVLHPAATCFGAVFAKLQLRSRPKDRLLGSNVEPFGIKQRTAIVVAQNTELELHRLVQALAGVRTVANHIAKAHDPIDVLSSNVFQYGFQCRQVSVNVAQDGCSSHFVLTQLVGREKMKPDAQPWNWLLGCQFCLVF